MGWKRTSVVVHVYYSSTRVVMMVENQWNFCHGLHFGRLYQMTPNQEVPRDLPLLVIEVAPRGGVHPRAVRPRTPLAP